ncbi:MAG: cytochrome c1 [Betaproteobacteria bacterium]|nr:cytochrome c1 [Betaproteobacteria bacterium]
MNKLITTLLAALVLSAGPAAASGGDDILLEPAPINRLDNESLQRGARTFVNYCLNCHSARYMRYNRLTDLGLTEEQIKDNLILNGAKIRDPMTVAMPAADAKAWFGAPPPDLSVESRVRGVDWLYNYFLGFYQDEKSATGWNNLVFPNVGMPHVLWELSAPTGSSAPSTRTATRRTARRSPPSAWSRSRRCPAARRRSRPSRWRRRGR